MHSQLLFFSSFFGKCLEGVVGLCLKRSQNKWHYNTLYETKKEVQYNAILFMKHVSHNKNLEQKFYICINSVYNLPVIHVTFHELKHNLCFM